MINRALKLTRFKREKFAFNIGRGFTDVKQGSVKGIVKGSKYHQEGDENNMRASSLSMKTSDDLTGSHGKADRAIFVTKLGAGANAGLALSKGVVGFVIGSTALVADAVNSASDLLGDGVVYYTVKEARKGSTPDRPWGRGKAEPIGALIVSSILLTTGLGIGYSAFHSALEMVVSSGLLSYENNNEIVNYMFSLLPKPEGHGLYADTEGISPIQMAALGISCVSIFVKEFLYRVTLNAGKEADSAAVIANAHQHRADASISTAVFAGLTGSTLGFPILDPIAGILVSGLIVKQGVVMAMESLRDLSDSPATAEETQKLRESCLIVPGIITVENLLARKSGPYLFVECTVGVAGTISASAAHRLAALARHSLLQRHKGRVANAVVHVNPLGSAGMGESLHSWARDHDHIAKEVTKAVLSLPDITAVSEVQVYYKDDGRIVVKVDVSMNPELTIRAAHALAVTARKAIEEVFPNIAFADVDLELDDGVILPKAEDHSTDMR